MCTNFEIPKQSGLNIIDKQMRELMEKQLELPVEGPTTEKPNPLSVDEKLEDWIIKNKQTQKRAEK